MTTPTTSSSSNSPCAACKFLRRKCTSECVFAPYFPPEEPQKFVNVHKIFGASNVTKILNDLQPHQREDAVNSLAYEAEARLKDPVYGCVGAITILQKQVHTLQRELAAAHADLLSYTSQQHHHHHEILSPHSPTSPVGFQQYPPYSRVLLNPQAIIPPQGGYMEMVNGRNDFVQNQNEQLLELAMRFGGSYEAALGVSNALQLQQTSPFFHQQHNQTQTQTPSSRPPSDSSGGSSSFGHLSPP